MLEKTGAGLALERLAAQVRRTPEETTLVDRAWHALMFEERAQHSLESLARRMRAAKKSGTDGFVITSYSIHYTKLYDVLGRRVHRGRLSAARRHDGCPRARAHMEQLILGAFVEAIDCTDDAETRA